MKPLFIVLNTKKASYDIKKTIGPIGTKYFLYLINMLISKEAFRWNTFIGTIREDFKR